MNIRITTMMMATFTFVLAFGFNVSIAQSFSRNLPEMYVVDQYGKVLGIVAGYEGEYGFTYVAIPQPSTNEWALTRIYGRDYLEGDHAAVLHMTTPDCSGQPYIIITPGHSTGQPPSPLLATALGPSKQLYVENGPVQIINVLSQLNPDGTCSGTSSGSYFDNLDAVPASWFKDLNELVPPYRVIRR